MTTTKTTTWRSARKGMVIQAKNLSLWELLSMGRGDDGRINVLMRAVEPGPDGKHREIQAHPTSYDDEIQAVEDTSWNRPGTEWLNPGRGLVATGTTPTMGEALDRIEAAAQRDEAERYGVPAEALDEAEAVALAAAEAAGYPMEAENGEDVPYTDPMPDLAPFDQADTPKANPADAAPMQHDGEIWEVQPVDKATAGAMMTHLFLFHGDWQQDNAKKGKALLADLHRIHDGHHAAADRTAGMRHEHKGE